MSTTNMIIGLALGVLLGAVIIAFRNRFRDVFSMLLVLGVVVLAVVVTIWRVDQYREEKAAAVPIADSQGPPPNAGIPPGPPPKPPVGLPPPSMGRGATGSAAPAAVEKPYAGDSK
jgi:predicted lipid-binding transport protein (Tim44 family)